MTPGRGLARAAGAIATAAVAGVAAGAARRNRDQYNGRALDENDPLVPFPGPRTPDGAPLRLVSMPTGEASLAPELIVCDDARECVAVAAAECRAVAVRREHASEVAVASCEAPAASYVPRCIHDLCRLESLSPEEVEAMRRREASEPPRDTGDDDTSGGEVPPPPPGYE